MYSLGTTITTLSDQFKLCFIVLLARCVGHRRFFSTGGNGREAEESHRVQFISSGFGLVLRFLLRVVVKFIRFFGRSKLCLRSGHFGALAPYVS